MAVVHNYISREITTSTAEGTEDVSGTKYVWFLMNDGTTDIKFNFDDLTTNANAFTLKAGEKLEQFPATVSVLHFKAASATPAFRFIGLKKEIE